ncbi:unnamed protein product [Nippostrongylus brasiliensis]|uniref:Transmembrane protein INAFM2 n=1 Tax=Nippostrongylus brasiliensis TaxID=27835 RepID=A0A0N4XDB4_NIPBR|nr:unnamed protein product [Nippostrongylus brasiliensis]
MNNCSGSNYSARLRSRTKQPVYTSDKRAKFTQRENKKWIRFVTVLGYIFFVSLPAVSLSIYYVYIWDPGYISKFPAEVINNSNPVHKIPILSSRLERNADPAEPLKTTPSDVLPSTPSEAPHLTDLAAILAEGSKSMESSSAETVQNSSS